MSCEENTRRLAADGQSDGHGIPFDNDLIKCCPMCAVPIEKDEGCAQMMCKRCKHVFCWYCLASLDVSIFHLFGMTFLTLKFFFPGRLPPAPLRQGPLQEQTRPLARLGRVAPGPGHRNLCRLRHPAAGGISAASAGGALYRVLQVSHLQRCGQTRRDGCGLRRRGGGPATVVLDGTTGGGDQSEWAIVGFLG